MANSQRPTADAHRASVQIGITCFFYFVDDLEEVLAILVLEHGLSKLAHALLGNPALTIGDALEAGYLEALALL